jgi:hypothetical protein
VSAVVSRTSINGVQGDLLECLDRAITVSIGNLSMLEARRAPLAASMAAMPLMSSLSGTALTVNHLSPEAGNARGFATL